MTSPRCYLNSLGTLYSAGNSTDAVKQNLLSGVAHITDSGGYIENKTVPLGLCRDELPEIPLPDIYWHSRNNQFALLMGRVQ